MSLFIALNGVHVFKLVPKSSKGMCVWAGEELGGGGGGQLIKKKPYQSSQC